MLRRFLKKARIAVFQATSEHEVSQRYRPSTFWRRELGTPAEVARSRSRQIEAFRRAPLSQSLYLFCAPGRPMKKVTCFCTDRLRGTCTLGSWRQARYPNWQSPSLCKIGHNPKAHLCFHHRRSKLERQNCTWRLLKAPHLPLQPASCLEPPGEARIDPEHIH